jgi:hypothetical protein
VGVVCLVGFVALAFRAIIFTGSALAGRQV